MRGSKEKFMGGGVFFLSVYQISYMFLTDPSRSTHEIGFYGIRLVLGEQKYVYLYSVLRHSHFAIIPNDY